MAHKWLKWLITDQRKPAGKSAGCGEQSPVNVPEGTGAGVDEPDINPTNPTLMGPLRCQTGQEFSKKTHMNQPLRWEPATNEARVELQWIMNPRTNTSNASAENRPSNSTHS